MNQEGTSKGKAHQEGANHALEKLSATQEGTDGSICGQDQPLLGTRCAGRQSCGSRKRDNQCIRWKSVLRLGRFAAPRHVAAATRAVIIVDSLQALLDDA